MKKIIATFCFLTLSNAALAENLQPEIASLQQKWESAKYHLKEKDERLAKYEECALEAQELRQNFPQYAEPIIWQGICTASQAELLKLSALGKAKKAKELFEEALKIDETTLYGSAYTNLGVLYHRVPGWPIGFGDSELAAQNFKKALAIAPNNIDANYFYALFLESEGEKEKALQFLQKAMDAPKRPNREFADKMRRQEIATKIAELKN